jgi:hypothetical protein
MYALSIGLIETHRLLRTSPRHLYGTYSTISWGHASFYASPSTLTSTSPSVSSRLQILSIDPRPDHATDLRPCSIHLTECNAPGDRPAYRKPVIGALDQTKLLGFDTTTDISGHPGFQAPEQLAMSFQPTTDIFLIAITIWCVMHRSTSGIDFSGDIDIEIFLVAEREKDSYDNFYSVGLEVVLQDCLQTRPEQRPSFNELRERVTNAMVDWDQAHGEKIFMINNAFQWKDAVDRWEGAWFPEDSFPVGQAYKPRRY